MWRVYPAYISFLTVVPHLNFFARS